MKTKHELRSYFSIYAHVYLKRTNNILSIVHSIVFYPATILSYAMSFTKSLPAFSGSGTQFCLHRLCNIACHHNRRALSRCKWQASIKKISSLTKTSLTLFTQRTLIWPFHPCSNTRICHTVLNSYICDILLQRDAHYTHNYYVIIMCICV